MRVGPTRTLCNSFRHLAWKCRKVSRHIADIEDEMDRQTREVEDGDREEVDWDVQGKWNAIDALYLFRSIAERKVYEAGIRIVAESVRLRVEIPSTVAMVAHCVQRSPSWVAGKDFVEYVNSMTVIARELDRVILAAEVLELDGPVAEAKVETPVASEMEQAKISLTDNQQAILEATTELRAVSKMTLRTRDEIVKKALGSDTNSPAYSRDFAELVRVRLLGSCVGRGGGYWVVTPATTATR